MNAGWKFRMILACPCISHVFRSLCKTHRFFFFCDTCLLVSYPDPNVRNDRPATNQPRGLDPPYDREGVINYVKFFMTATVPIANLI